MKQSTKQDTAGIFGALVGFLMVAILMIVVVGGFLAMILPTEAEHAHWQAITADLREQ